MPAEFTINPWGLTGAFAILMAWSLAVFLLRSAERDRLTVLFAIVLLVEGAVLFTSSSGIALLLKLSPPIRWYTVAHHTADCLMLIVYPLFLAHALPQRFLRVLRRPWAVPVLAAIATGAWAAYFVTVRPGSSGGGGRRVSRVSQVANVRRRGRGCADVRRDRPCAALTA